MLSLKGHQHQPSRCFGHPDCPMTGGYYIGGGHYTCWLHILFIPGAMKLLASQHMVAMPTVEQQHEIDRRTGENASNKAQPIKMREPALQK